MASTYENDLRLEEMATGENSGSWGTKTNTNLELVADAFSYGTEIIANADTAITIADGAADAARSLALKITSSEDLTTTRVITLGPNTVSKVWIIENSTSGGQTLTISAGSGTNITLLNGQTKIIATDGIGAGSNVVELTQDIAIADLFVDENISMQSDGAAINFGTDAEIQLTHVADTGLLLTETGGGAPTLQIRDSALSISSSADGQIDIDADTEVEIVAPTVDIDASTAMTVDTTTFTVTGNTVLDGDLTVDTDTLYVDSTNDRVGINEATPLEALHVTTSDSGTTISKTVGSTSGPVFVLDNTDDTTNNLAAIQFASSGSSSADVVATTGIYSINTGRGGTYSYGDLAFYTTGSGGTHAEAMRIDSSQRVLIGYSDTFSNAGHNAAVQVVGQGTADYHGATVSINGFSNNSNGAYLNFGSGRSNTAGTYTIVANDDTLGLLLFAGADGSNLNSYGASIGAFVDGAPGSTDMPGRLVFSTTADGASGSTERMRINSAGKVRIGSGDPSLNFEVVGSGDQFIFLQTTDTSDGVYIKADSGGDGVEFQTAGGQNQFGFRTSGNLAMTIDSSQRVLIGHASSIAIEGGNQNLQLIGTSSNDGLSIARFNTDFGPYFNFGRSGSGTIGTMTAVPNNDELGRIQWGVADGTDMSSMGASISAYTEQTAASNDVPSRLVFKTTSDGGTSPTERMRISSTGRVGIGVQGSNVQQSGSSTQLQVQDSKSDEDLAITLRNYATGGSTTTSINFINTTSSEFNHGTIRAGRNGAGYLAFSTNNNSEAMRIDDQQRVLLGTGPNSTSTPTTGWWNSSSLYSGILNVQNVNSGSASKYVSLAVSRHSNDAESGQLGFAKSRGSAVNSKTTVGVGDGLGLLTFQGADGSNFVEAARITGATDGTAAGDDMPGRLQFYTTADGASSPTERMRVNSSGRVSIAGAAGNVNPPTTLMGDMNAYLRVGSSGAQIGSMVKYSHGPNTNVDGAVFQLRTGSNGSAAYIRITVSNYQGVFEAHYYCNNASGNWNVTQATVTDVGGANAPALNYTSGVTNPTITVDLNNTSYSGGFLDVTASSAWTLTLA